MVQLTPSLVEERVQLDCVVGLDLEGLWVLVERAFAVLVEVPSRGDFGLLLGLFLRGGCGVLLLDLEVLRAAGLVDPVDAQDAELDLEGVPEGGVDSDAVEPGERREVDGALLEVGLLREADVLRQFDLEGVFERQLVLLPHPLERAQLLGGVLL